MAIAILSTVTIGVLLIVVVASVNILNKLKSHEIPFGEIVMAVIGHASQQGNQHSLYHMIIF